MSSLTRSALASLLLAAPVLAESTGLVRGDGGPGVGVFAATQVVGWLLAGSVARDLVIVIAARSRWGSRLVLGGIGLQVVFALAYGLSWALAGEAAEASFWAFLLGFVCLTVGGVMWALRLRRTPNALAGVGLGLVSLLGLAAIAVGDSVVHEVTLVGSYAAWVLVGSGVRPRSAVGVERVSASSR